MLGARKLFNKGIPKLLWVTLLLTATHCLALRPPSATATERVSIRYGLFGRSVSVSALADFARDGTTDRSLEWYLRNVDAETRDDLRRALTASRDINPSEFSQLLHTPEGESMLRFAGELIKTNSDQNGAKAIRGALVLAASRPEGLSLLTFLQEFPTPQLQLDLQLILSRYSQISRTVTEIDTFLDSVRQASQTAAANTPLAVESIPPLGETGTFSVSRQSLLLQDPSRDRTYPVDLYYPQVFAEVEGDLPVLVLSHGLGGTRERFVEFGDHLASHGFVVAIPEHIGSNKNQQEAVKRWLANELFQINEFVDRPLDISFLLDELERLNASDFEGRLNLTRVGVVGHSMGGYTALTLAGATVDIDRVNQLCRPGSNIDVGLSLLLTCRLLELQDTPDVLQVLTQGDLRDPRVGLVMGVNPVSHLFGETGMSQIEVPVVMVGGTSDFAAPILREQAEPFSWLTTPDRHLLVVESISHNAEITTLINGAFYSIDEEELEISRQELRANIKAILVGFAQVYVAEDNNFQPFISSAYLEAISQDPFSFNMVQDLSPNLLPTTPDSQSK